MDDHVSGEDESSDVDRSWHLATTPLEVDMAELEYSLMRSFEAFGRWQTECLAMVVDLAASGPENALLHIIRMHNRPKTMKDMARLANREDIPNMQYSLRKLVSAGLVVRSGSGRSGVTYSVTEKGFDVTNRYAKVRASLLVRAVQSMPDLAARLRTTADTLDLMTGVYDQVARTAATHRRRP